MNNNLKIMIASKQKVKEICDRLMQVNPAQIIIDLVQEGIEDILNNDDITPDAIGAACYDCSILREVYNPNLDDDINYLIELEFALKDWEKDATFANRALGLDPNE